MPGELIKLIGLSGLLFSHQKILNHSLCDVTDITKKVGQVQQNRWEKKKQL